MPWSVQSVAYIRHDGYPREKQQPNPSREKIVVGEEQRPRSLHDVVPEAELEGNGHDQPRHPDHPCLFRALDRPHSTDGPNEDPRKHNPGQRRDLVRRRFGHARAVRAFSEHAVADGDDRKRKPAQQIPQHTQTPLVDDPQRAIENRIIRAPQMKPVPT